MECIYCKKDCYKKGKRNGTQRYQCKHCKKYQQQKYIRCIISKDKYDLVVKLNKEGCGISNISRVLEITKSSVQRVIIRIASKIQIPIYFEPRWRRLAVLVALKSAGAGELSVLSLNLLIPQSFK